MQAEGAVRFYAKRLAPNDNSKNQIYLGAGFVSLNVLPHGEVTTDVEVRAGAVRSRDKATLRLYWVDAAGLAYAPGAQLILYPRYPEVRMSGFLDGCDRPPEPMTTRRPGRVLILGICEDGRILAFVADADDAVATSLDAAEPLEKVGVFLDLTSLRAGVADARAELLDALEAVNRKGWIASQKIGRSGAPEPYSAPNGGGYTLEAELGISPNGYAAPDFLGWEVKQYAVSDFARCLAQNPVTLMTPEPNGGVYRDAGVEAFLVRFGYPDRRGREARINFGGIYRAGGAFNSATGLSLSIDGFDVATGKITDLDGGLVLRNAAGENAASWGLRGLMDHWNRKHAKAVYVPSISRTPPPEYHYAARWQLCEATDFLLFLSAVAAGAVYYDPAVKRVEHPGGRIEVKRRSQWRIPHAALDRLYKRSVWETR